MPFTEYRFILIDQSLKGFAGHHHEYAVAVVRAAQALGLDVAVATHRNYPREFLSDAPIVWRFATDWYAAHRKRGIQKLFDILSTLPSWLRLPIVRTASVLRRLTTQTVSTLSASQTFGASVERIIEERDLSGQDHIFLPTISIGDVTAIAEILSGRRSLPHIHIVLRRDVDGDLDAQGAFRILIQKMRADAELSRSCHFYADTAPLADQYSRLGGPNVSVLPIPHCLRPSPKQKRENRHLNLVYLGEARVEKGYDLLPDLVHDLAESHLKTGRIRFIIQSNTRLSFDEPRMARARKLLSLWPPEQVQIINEALSLAAFHDVLLRADIVILPYRAERYRRRSSGILIMAMVAGIPTVVPAGTWLAAEAPKFAHVTFDDRFSLLEATQAAIDNHPSLSTAAQAAASPAFERHNAMKLVNILLTKTK